MATIVSWNGSSFTVPATGEENWGGATKVDGLLISLAQNSLQKTGGTFTLSADVDFGGTAGLKAGYYKSRAATVADAGIIRLAKTETIAWRNNAAGGNNTLSTDTSDNLTYNGAIIASVAGLVPVAAGGTGIASYTAGDTLYASGATTLSKLAIGTANKAYVSTGTAPSWALLVNANIDAAAAISYSKLNLAVSVVNADIAVAAAIARSKIAAGTASHVLINDGSGNLSSEAALAVTRGGTGLATLTANNVMLGNGTSTPGFVAPGTSGNVLTSDGSTWASSTPATSPDESYQLANLTLTATVAASALTIALKDKAGSDPSGGSPVKIGFRSATAATGTYVQRSVTAALSVVVSSGSTLGHTSAVQGYVYVYAIDNAGTVELAVSSKLFDEGSRVSTTAEGGAGASDAAATMYSTTARTDVACRLIGRLASTQATAGTWATAISEISLQPFEQKLIYARYTSNAGQSIPTGVQIINFEDVVTDTHKCVAIGASWAFTAPKTGLYDVKASVRMNGGTFNSGEYIELTIYKNGSAFANIDKFVAGASDIANNGQLLAGSDDVPLAEGDTLDVRINNGIGTTETLDTSATENHISITFKGSY